MRAKDSVYSARLNQASKLIYEGKTGAATRICENVMRNSDVKSDDYARAQKLLASTSKRIGAVALDDLMSQREEANLRSGIRKFPAGIEAYGVKGMKNTQWRKVFKNEAAMEKWVDENDAEVQGTRNNAEDIAPITIKSGKDRVLGKGAVGDGLAKGDLKKYIDFLDTVQGSATVKAQALVAKFNLRLDLAKDVVSFWIAGGSASDTALLPIPIKSGKDRVLGKGAVGDGLAKGELKKYIDFLDTVQGSATVKAQALVAKFNLRLDLAKDVVSFWIAGGSASDVAPVPVGEDATNPNPRPRVMTSAALPTPEDVQRVYGRKISPEEFKKTFGHDDAKGMTSTELRDEIRSVKALISGSAGITLSRTNPDRYEQLNKRLTELLDAASYRTKANDGVCDFCNKPAKPGYAWCDQHLKEHFLDMVADGDYAANAYAKYLRDMKTSAKANDVRPVPVRGRDTTTQRYASTRRSKDVEGYMAGGTFHPIRGTKGYTKKAAGEARRKHNRRAHDTASTEQVLRSAGFKRIGGSSDSDDWEKGEVGVTTFKTSDEWFYFLGGWDEGGRGGKGAAQLAGLTSRANDIKPVPVRRSA